tara:strand:- start:929 stop:2902 length:1974 start_codon:yes stop_codon:yes gene_type:complete
MNPLNLRIQDNEIRQQRIETDVVYPIHIQDGTSNGRCRFTLKHRGMLDPDSRIILPATTNNAYYQYAPTGGVFSLIKSATLRVGAVVVAQTENLHLLMAKMNLLRPLEHREGIDRPLHGVLSSWESGSGSKNIEGNTALEGATVETLAGQMRIKSDLPYLRESYNRPVNANMYVNTQEHPAYTLQGGASSTPEFMVSLQQLFPGFMGQNLELPVELINPNDNIEIELEFTDDGSWGSNDRAILTGSASLAGGIATISMGTTAGAGYAVGDRLSVTHDGASGGVVEVTAINGANGVTQFKVINAGKAYETGNNKATVALSGSGANATIDIDSISSQWTLQDYDTHAAGQKIPIDTTNVRLLADYIFYEDGKPEMIAKQMMSEQGLAMTYTQFRNVNTTLNAGITNQTDIADGAKEEKEFTRQVGLANEVVRQMSWQLNATGNMPNDGVRPGQSAKNILLLDYCSQGSLVEGGMKHQVTVNSVPYYPSNIDHEQHSYVLHKECFGAPLYVPLGMYNGAVNCKQRDDVTDAENSVQPGFSAIRYTGAAYSEAITGALSGSRRYAIDYRKAGIANQLCKGLEQQANICGRGAYRGISFKLGKGNVPGNGIAVGNTPVVLDLTHNFVKEAGFNRNLKLNLWAEVERQFVLKNGFVSVSGASF